MIKIVPLLFALAFGIPANAGTFSEDFANGVGSFVYSDAEAYATEYVDPGFIGIRVGGLDDADISDIAGGWNALFTGFGVATVTIEYTVSDSGTTEAGECVRAEVYFPEVGHTELLDELCGITNPTNSPRSLGNQTKTFTVDLGTVERELTVQLVGRLTLKTYRNEIGEVEFSSITIVTEDPTPEPEPEPPVDNGDCPKPTIETSCYGVAYPKFDMCWDPSSGPVDHYSVRSNGVEVATSTTERVTLDCGAGAAEPAGAQGEMIITVVPMKADGTEGPSSDASASVYCSCPAPDLVCNGNANVKDLNLWRKLYSLGCRSVFPGVEF